MKTRPCEMCVDTRTGAGFILTAVDTGLRTNQPVNCLGFGRGSISFKARSISS